MDDTTIHAYTDGGCRGNPGIGAWAFLLVDRPSGQALERGAAVATTTNNRMEMTAAIQALLALRRSGSRVHIHSDSRYLIDCCSKWIPGWKARGWRKANKKPVKNRDLLEELDRLLGLHVVTWEWVPGHAGVAGNERVDTIVNQCMDVLAVGGDGTHEQRGVWNAA